MKARYSARKYANRPIEAEKLDYIMECVRFAPSAVNFQHELKETQKGIELMCHEMEKNYSAGMKSGKKRGELKTQKETVLFMAEEGMDVKQIVRLVKVTEKEVQKWIDESLCVMK